jgi:hypothetical protein
MAVIFFLDSRSPVRWSKPPNSFARALCGWLEEAVWLDTKPCGLRGNGCNICPGCGRRVAELYPAGVHFRCRKCCGLGGPHEGARPDADLRVGSVDVRPGRFRIPGSSWTSSHSAPPIFSLGIWKFSKNQELVKEFIAYLFQKQNFDAWIVASLRRIAALAGIPLVSTLARCSGQRRRKQQP